jgi:hypothetical protein
LTDRNFLLGLGIGIVIATTIMFSYSPNNISRRTIEQKAKDLGMMYPDEIKAFFDTEKK